MSTNPWMPPPPKTKEDARRDFDALFIVVKPEPAPSQKPQAPTITVQLESKKTVPCRAVSFWIEAEGTAPLTFVWRKNRKDFKTQVEEGDGLGGFIASETTYTHTALDLTDDGAVFDVVVSNAAGSVTSEAVTLIVNAAPPKTEQENIAAMLQVPNAVRQHLQAKDKRVRTGKTIACDYSDRSDRDVRFQQFAFSWKLARGASSHTDTQEWSDGDNWKKPFGKFERKADSKGSIVYHKGPSHGVDSEGDLNGEDRMRLFNGLSKGAGISVRDIESDPGASGPRPETPQWLLHFSNCSKCFSSFLLRLANKKMKPDDRFEKGKDVCPIGRKALIEAAGLDYLILRDFYLLRREDREIFERYEAQFKLEKGRKRHTSSEDAVKQRRLRLVAAGDKLYIPRAKDDSAKL